MNNRKYILSVVVCLAILGMSETQAQVYIEYQADDMPETVGYTDRDPSCGTRTVSGGILRIVDDTRGLCGWYEQFQPFASGQDGVFEARVKVNASSHFLSLQFGFCDGEKRMHVRLLTDQVSQSEFGASFMDTTVFHVYRLEKHGTSHVSLYVDNIELETQPYADYTVETLVRQGFGGGWSTGTCDVEYDYFRFVIGSYEFPPYDMLSTDGKTELPDNPDRRYDAVLLPWSDPDDPITNPGLAPLLFYRYEPYTGMILLTKSGNTVKVEV